MRRTVGAHHAKRPIMPPDNVPTPENIAGLTEHAATHLHSVIPEHRGIRQMQPWRITRAAPTHIVHHDGVSKLG